MKEYALYKGDKLIGVGTVAKLARVLGVKRETVKFYGTKTYKRRLEDRKTKNARLLIELED